MPTWYETYDNQDALLATRQRVSRLTTRYGMAAVTVALSAPLVILHVPHGPWVAVGTAAALALAGLFVLRALRTLHAVAWCVRLSFQGMVTDFGQRRTAMRWSEVARVELDDEGLVVVGTDEGGTARRFRIPHDFPRYAHLSHRVVEYAEAHGRPVFVDGRPWQLLDLHALYPFLADAVGEA
ncbi:MAG TPA: hypothetical protein VK002_07615 [Rubricoccaceae bacterium]|nr:hypothetical protein [Rubricoccaceae bacterium]